MFELVIGEMEMILGYMTQEQDFEEMLLEVWLKSADETGLESGMANWATACWPPATPCAASKPSTTPSSAKTLRLKVSKITQITQIFYS
jgi:hypothetical protein